MELASTFVTDDDGSFVPYVPPVPDAPGAASGSIGTAAMEQPKTGVTVDELRYGATPSTTVNTSRDVTTWDSLVSLVGLGNNVYANLHAAQKPGNVPASGDQSMNRTTGSPRAGAASDAGASKPTPGFLGGMAPVLGVLVLAVIGWFLYRWIGALIGAILGFFLGKWFASRS